MNGPWNIVSVIYNLYLIDNRYPSSLYSSSADKLLNLQMPLAQGKDGKSSLNFGKNEFEEIISVENVYRVEIGLEIVYGVVIN